jgi:beta-1,4-mannosyl-glycoprotein beta-1,4-N-acetylglucosaminyltransferase
MKIVDGFIFYNELTMLSYRLELLDPVVDYFILVEATHTHAGKEKPLYYQENKEQYKQYSKKIIHIIVDDFPHVYPNIIIENGEQWTNENFQRDCIARGIHKLLLDDDDIIIISDLDEIPDPYLLRDLKRTNQFIVINTLEQDFYYYNLTTKMTEKWYKAKIIGYATYKLMKFTCNEIRHYDDCSFVYPGGWHLSYFGNAKFIQNKLQNFAHQEHNTEENTNLESIEEHIKNSTDLFGREISFKKVPLLENKYLPPLYQKIILYL